MRDSVIGLSDGTTMAKRGSTLCAVCGCSNGNRAESCKDCKSPFPKRVKKAAQDQTHKHGINVSHLLLSESLLEDDAEVYSVRIRSQGPDYRYQQVVAHTGFLLSST